jgi:hypothetical protein
MGMRLTYLSSNQQIFQAVAPDTPRELLPDDITDSRRFLCFLFFVLQAG